MKKSVYLLMAMVWLAGCTDGRQYAQILDRAQEQNLNRETITDIDSIQMAAGYYDRHGNSNDKVRAYYLLGCAHRDAGEAPNALEAFHEAADRADTTSADCDYGLLMRVHAQSAMLFKYQLLPYEMLDELWAQRRNALLAGDDRSAITAIERTADAYRLMNMKDSAVNIQLRASDLYEQYGFHEAANIALGPIIDDLVERGDTAEARRCIERYEGSKSIFKDGEILPHKAVHYYSKGKYCLAVGKLDSAEVYFRKLIEPGRNASQLEAGYRGLFLLYRTLWVVDSLAKYADLQYEQVIPALDEKNKDDIQLMQGLYNYSRIQNDAKKTAEKNEQQKDMIIILLVAVIALALVAVCVGKLLGFALKRPVYDVKVNTPGNFISNEIHQKLSIKDNGQE
jgi:tetratricopeptide (TPR) repeat protein